MVRSNGEVDLRREIADRAGGTGGAGPVLGAECQARGLDLLRALWELTKPGITRMVVITTAAGFYLGSEGSVALGSLGHTLLGTGLVAGGTNALNQIWERDVDARMRRTQRRPLPSGRLATSTALVFAVGISMVGIVYLAFLVGRAPAVIVSLSLISYVFLYTPLKKRTTLATLVGAVPGALPILAGWAAASDELGLAAWALFGILFLWQVPHFLALAWIYREQYRDAGLANLTQVDPHGRRTGWQVVFATVGLLIVSALPSELGVTGPLYQVAALSLGAGFLGFGVAMHRSCSERRAGKLFLASVAYLPLLILFMFVDKAG